MARDDVWARLPRASGGRQCRQQRSTTSDDVAPTPDHEKRTAPDDDAAALIWASRRRPRRGVGRSRPGAVRQPPAGRPRRRGHQGRDGRWRPVTPTRAVCPSARAPRRERAVPCPQCRQTGCPPRPHQRRRTTRVRRPPRPGRHLHHEQGIGFAEGPRSRRRGDAEPLPAPRHRGRIQRRVLDATSRRRRHDSAPRVCRHRVQLADRAPRTQAPATPGRARRLRHRRQPRRRRDRRPLRRAAFRRRADSRGRIDRRALLLQRGALDPRQPRSTTRLPRWSDDARFRRLVSVPVLPNR